jgi:hypothetical protein
VLPARRLALIVRRIIGPLAKQQPTAREMPARFQLTGLRFDPGCPFCYGRCDNKNTWGV